MKFAFCLFKYFPFGGLQRDFLRIAKECLKRGHLVDVYVMTWEGKYEPGIPVHKIRCEGLQNHSRIEHFIQKVKPLLAQGDYDLVVGFNKMPNLDVYYAADTCYQAKARRQHGWLYRLTGRYRHYVKNEAAVFSPSAKAEILLLSAAQEKEFIGCYHTQPERFHLLPPGIDKDRLRHVNAPEIRVAMREAFQIKENEFLVVLIGSGFRTKGLDRAIIGLASLPKELLLRTRLFVVGADNAKAFESQAKHLDIQNQVTFLGGREDVPHFLLAADLLVHPAYNENTGTVLLEALVAGLPVIVTDVCGYASYIEAAAAGVVLSSPFQQVEFNQKLAEMLSSPYLKTWGKNGQLFAESADIYSLPVKAVNLLESLRPG